MQKNTKPVVFRNGLLVDGSGPDPVGPVDVLVENGRISAVSRESLAADDSATGEAIVVHYVAPAGKPSRWVGIFSPPTRADLSDSDGIQYQYLEEEPVAATEMVNGNLVFNGMSAGRYQARLHDNDDYPIKARIEFTVK